jgi:hypothetical protein
MCLVFAIPPGSDPLKAKMTVCDAVRSATTFPRFVSLTHSRFLVVLTHFAYREKVLIASLEQGPALIIT